MATDAQMALVDIFLGDWSQILISGILVQAVALLAPSDPIIELAHLLLGVFH
jgi:hypothetical protein